MKMLLSVLTRRPALVYEFILFARYKQIESRDDCTRSREQIKTHKRLKQ